MFLFLWLISKHLPTNFVSMLEFVFNGSDMDTFLLGTACNSLLLSHSSSCSISVKFFKWIFQLWAREHDVPSLRFLPCPAALIIEHMQRLNLMEQEPQKNKVCVSVWEHQD